MMKIGMLRREQEWCVAQLLAHPALARLLAIRGLDRRSVDLLLETRDDERRTDVFRPEEPIPE